MSEGKRERDVATENQLWQNPDWTCPNPNCRAVNLAIRERCRICGYDSNCGEFPWYNPLPPYEGLRPTKHCGQCGKPQNARIHRIEMYPGHHKFVECCPDCESDDKTVTLFPCSLFRQIAEGKYVSVAHEWHDTAPQAEPTKCPTCGSTNKTIFRRVYGEGCWPDLTHDPWHDTAPQVPAGDGLEEKAREYVNAGTPWKFKFVSVGACKFAADFARSVAIPEERRRIAAEMKDQAADLDRKFGKFEPNVVLTNELRRWAAKLEASAGRNR